MQTLDQPPPTTVVSSAFYLPKSGRFGDGLILDDQLLQVLPPTIELLDYFRQRVSDFEKLEEDYVARIEALADSAPGTSLVIDREISLIIRVVLSERHKARWQYIRCEEEVQELQSALRY